MNTTIASMIRIASIVATVTVVAAGVSAKSSKSPDRALELLSAHGSVSIKAAGPYIHVGSFPIWVDAKLGKPSVKLADGTWLYRNYEVQNSAARGTLVVRFTDGRVSGISLVSRAVETALLAPKPTPVGTLIASSK